MAYTEYEKAKVVADWKSGQYSRQEISQKYEISKATIESWTWNIDKGALKKEIEELAQSKIRKKMLKALESQQINPGTIAKELKDLVDKGDNALKLKAIQEINKILGSYAMEKTDVTSDGQSIAPSNIYIPKNSRDKKKHNI